jgi:hypothetical protein
VKQGTKSKGIKTFNNLKKEKPLAKFALSQLMNRVLIPVASNKRHTYIFSGDAKYYRSAKSVKITKGRPV